MTTINLQNVSAETECFIVPSIPFVCHIQPIILPIIGKKAPFVGNRRNIGFSLVELIVTLTVAGILLTVSVPSFINFVRSNRLVGITNNFVADLNLARTEALKRGVGVGVCSTASGGSSCSGSTNWNTGWIVFADIDDTKTTAWTASDVVLYRRDAVPPEIAITASADAVFYGRNGLTAAGAGNYSFCNPALGKTKDVTVNATGRHQLTQGTC